MKKLTENQKTFLLEYFFKNETFAGWKNIATVLIDTGNCIVAGTTCIWIGGIGNFIKTKNTDNAIGCLLYEFDLNYFISSEWFKENSKQYISILSDKKQKIEEEYKDICALL
jgi:hypothetical protein